MGWSIRIPEAMMLLLLGGPVAPAIAVEPFKAEIGKDFPVLPLPPDIDGLIGLSPAPPIYDAFYRDRLVQAALQNGLPPPIAEAVAFIESKNNLRAAGADGEIGLMQILPATAAMLGHTGTVGQLFEPETNIRYGVLYLAKAWRLANGDLCRALMKYRAGHAEERMTALSFRYCNQARAYLRAARFSPEMKVSATDVELVELSPAVASTRSSYLSSPPRWMSPGRPGQPRTAEDSRHFWAAHEARIKRINARLNARFQNIKIGS